MADDTSSPDGERPTVPSAYQTTAAGPPPPRATREQPLVQPREAFTELGRLVVGSHSLSEVLTRVGELAQACVPGAEEVSVTLLEGGRGPRSAAFTGSLAVHLDERQYASGFGPCLDAAETGQTIRIDDTTTEPVYPAFAAVAARQGVRSIVSVGMSMPQRIQGAVNVYRFDGPAMDADAVQVLRRSRGTPGSRWPTTPCTPPRWP